MPFDPNTAPPYDPLDPAWALWRVRDATGDTGGEPDLTDAQWTVRLGECAARRTVGGEARVYFRPLEAAARWILRPTAQKNRMVGETQISFLDPLEAARELRAAQADLDADIPADASAGGSGGSIHVGWGPDPAA